MKLCREDFALYEQEIERQQVKPLDPAYDVMLAVQAMVFNAALQMGGVYLLWDDDDGNKLCPLCEARKNIPEDVTQEQFTKFWVESAVEYVKEMAETPKEKKQ